MKLDFWISRFDKYLNVVSLPGGWRFHEFGSILKFIEATFNLPSLGYADSPADDLSDCFNFTQTPLTFQTIPAALDAAHFINDTRPSGGPDDD